jgi:general secretion pathway protein L
MASTLYIQIPSKTVAETMDDCFQQAFPYCLASSSDNVLQHGFKSFADLKSLAQAAQQVVLLLAASDVNLVSVKVPPLPLAKLRAALPNMLEDQVLVDPSQLMFICQTPKQGKAIVAIVGRGWMEAILAQAQVLNARKLSAFALSTAMQKPDTESTTNVLIEMHGSSLELALSTFNTVEKQASGMTMQLDYVDSQPNFFTIFQTLQVLAPQSNLNIVVDSQWLHQCESAVANLTSDEWQIQCRPMDWKSKIAGADVTNIDLFSILLQENNQSIDWQRWRLTMILGLTALCIAMLGFNWKWWKLNKEATQLRISIITTYKNTFPKEGVFRDPIVQMQQNIDSSKKAAGQSTKEDFIVLASQFAQSWDALVGAGSATVNYIEYKDQYLYVKPAESVSVDLDQLRNSLKERSLKVEMNDGIYKVSVDKGDLR